MTTPDRAFVIALLGAESTGKTTLANELRAALMRDASASSPQRIAVVGEYLREFCDAHGRTPRVDEQRSIAHEQMRRIDDAATNHDIVIADTTALMIAVYSDQVFGDTSLYSEAQAAHKRCDVTLLTALDLPWLPDGLQRDGPHVRDPVDAKVRRALSEANIDYCVVGGQGHARLEAALSCVKRALQPPSVDGSDSEGSSRWHWFCERCGDANCERHGLRLKR